MMGNAQTCYVPSKIPYSLLGKTNHHKIKKKSSYIFFLSYHKFFVYKKKTKREEFTKNIKNEEKMME